MSPLKNIYISAIIRPILTNFHKNDAIGDDNKSVTLADSEIKRQGHISQSNISYCQSDLNKIFFKFDVFFSEFYFR